VSQTNGEWIQAIAQRAAVDAGRVESILAAHHISPTPVLPSPRRLLLIQIAFAGAKDKSGIEVPFSFDWSDLSHGLWAMLSDKNLRGKSSILEVVHWLLRGRPTSNLQEDVRRWIHKANVRFMLDGVEHEVSIECKGGHRGSLVRLGKSGNRVSLAEFQTEDAFEAVMADFFMSALSMEAITSWQSNPSNSEDDAGRAVSHGWAAFSGAMFIGTNYETLLGDMPVASGLNPRLIQMYIGVPWVSTLASSQSAFKAGQNALDARSRKQAQAQESRQERESEIEGEITTKRNELAALPSDDELRGSLGQLNSEFASVLKQQAVLEKRLSNEIQAEEESRLLSLADRKELQAHLDSMAAGAIFRMLDPTYCPRCDNEISEAKKRLEHSTHACSVCGEVTETDEDAEAIKDDLEQRAKASKTAYDKAAKAAGSIREQLAGSKTSSNSLQAQIGAVTAQLGSYQRQQDLAREIAVLEGRSAEAKRDVSQSRADHQPDEMKALGAIVTETENRVKAVRDDLLRDVSARIVYYAQRFGMHALTEASLKAHAALFLVKGGTRTSYSKVTAGEKLRLKVATILAMLEIGEQKGVGRHPGLLMIDSPGAQEVSQADLDALISGLQSVAKDIPHCQIFVAARSSEAITDHVPSANRREAVDGGFLW
jgi:hypothetical protein